MTGVQTCALPICFPVTIKGSASAGLTFSIPAQEDFTDGSWTPYDLALSEIGVNEEDKKVYIRINDEIKEFGLYGSGSTLGVTPSWGQVLSVGNTSDGNDIIMNSASQILSGTGEILTAFSDTGIDISSDDTFYQQNLTFNPLSGTLYMSTTENVSGDFAQFAADIQTQFISMETFTSPNISKVELTSSAPDAKMFITDAVVYSEISLQPNLNTWNQSIGATYTAVISMTPFSGILIDCQDQTSGFAQAQVQIEPNNFISLGHYNAAGDLTCELLQAGQFSVQTNDSGSSNWSNIISSGSQSIQLKQSDGVGGNFHELKVEKDGLKHNWNGGVRPVVYSLEAIQTLNATPTTMFALDVTGFSGSVITMDGIVSAYGATNSKAYGAKLFATFKYFSGTLAQISTTDKSEKTDFTTATSDFTTSGTDIIIEVTGEASTDINWITRFNYQVQ